MSELYVFTYYAISAVLILIMIYQGLARRVELLSYRNIYLAGFIIFQLLSCANIISRDEYGPYPIENKKDALELFFLYSILFLACFFISYHWLKLARWCASRFKPKQPLESSDWTLLMVGVALLSLGLFLRFVGTGVPLLRYFYFTIPGIPAACAVVGWVWAGRRFNVAVVTVGAAIFSISALTAVWATAGRRPIISVCLALAWGAYYRLRGKLNLRKVLVWSVPFLLVTLHFGGAFSMHRSHHSTDHAEILKKTLTTSPLRSIPHVLAGSPDAQATLWALDAYPDRHEMHHLFSLRYLVYHSVPRALWPDKPEPLSRKVSRLARIKGVNHKVITLPPSVMGYAHAEGGFYALVIYAFFFGQFCRFFDEIIRQNPGNPFLIIPTGCVLGDLIGLPRGDIAIMANVNILGFLIIWFFFLIARQVIGRRQAAQRMYIPPQLYRE